ncbi:MAG: hypothetical protein IJC52_06075, partial [Clostridia bacterium]|nr:hypothetical protein [Clostridia bacterium]
VVHLGYGLEATDETIAWVNKTLETYRHRTAILVTHQYLKAQTAQRDTTGRGQLIYDSMVVPNSNVKAVFCGHDDGSLCLEKTTPDGRTVYEILADYQFVEAEPDDFYANEHYIGTVPECCGDGYIRELTVEGDTLSSITYSPVTDRYNPYGDQEKITLDLNVNAAARELTASNFSAAVLGATTTATNVDRMGLVSNGSTTTYTPVLYATVPSAPAGGGTSSAIAATPANPYYAQAATEIPTVSQKQDLLSALGYSNGKVIQWWTTSSNPLNFQIDLTKTPYLYYSITQPADSTFTFGFYSDMSTAPYFCFRDANKGGAVLSYPTAVWDSYTNGEQYMTTSETGCIDMRQYLTSASATTWEIDQVTFYNTKNKAVSIDYMFFGSADGTVSSSGTASSTPNDLAALQALITRANAIDKTAYQTAGVTELNNALTQANSALSGNAATVQTAYKRLALAIGDLRKIEATINASTLASIKNYPMTVSSYNVNAILQSTQNTNGFTLHIPTDQTNPWAAATTWSSYTVKPEGGKIYLNLDVSSESNWAIQMGITQNGVQKLVSMNVGVENSFYKADGISFEGDYKGVYEVSEALLINGFDPTATFTVNYTHLFCMGIGGRITYNHVELMTNASDGVRDTTALNAAIARAAQYTQSLYTADSWSTMQTALTAAKSALSDTSIVEADLNLKAYVLNNAIDALVYAGSYPELNGSLLPEDAANWKANTAGAITATRTNGITTIKNSNGQYPCMDYVLDEPMRVFVNEARLLADVTVGSAANILLKVGGEWISLNPYLSNVAAGDDLTAGTYTAGVVMSDIAEFKGKTSIEIEAVRVFSVGAAASSAVTLRTLRITEFNDYPWDPDLTTYGVAATPTNTYYQHCAPYAPEVANKVDVLAALGSNGPMAITGWANTAVNMTIDLNATPYLYYSIAIPEGGNACFGLFNNTNYAPYFVFRDGTKAGPGTNTGVGTWDAYTSQQQYLTKSETGCIDMRTLTNTGAETTWILTNLAVYNTSGKEATMSYLFFGSEPIYVETDINIGGSTEPDEPDEPTLDRGDVNDDGDVNSADVRLILAELTQMNSTFTDAQLDAGDYNGDGRMDSTDVRLMLDALINLL